MKKKKYHTVGTIPKSCKTKYHTVGTIPKSGRTKNTTLSEQFQNKIEKSQKQEKYMTTYFPGLEQFYGPKHPLLLK